MSLLVLIALLVLSASLYAAAPQTAEEQAAFGYMRRNMEPGRTYALNLGSPEQYAYVAAMLRYAGASKALATVEAARKGASSAVPTEVAAPSGQTSVLNAVEYLAADAKNATMALLSTVPGGTSSTSMMVSLIANEVVFASSPQYQEVNAGQHFVATFSAPIPSISAGAPITASALFIATFQGTPHVYSTMTTAGPGIARTQCVTGPNYGKRQKGAIPCPPAGSSCTNTRVKKPIVVCLARNGPCNYITDAPPTMFPFTIAGTITFSAPVDPSLTGQYMLDLQGADGACPIAGSGKFENPLTADFFSVDRKNPKLLRYCIRNNALPPSGCFAAGAKLYLSLTVYAQVMMDGGKKALATAVVSSDPKVTANASFVAKIPEISVRR
ncbi:MAG: hypothetical protein ABI039_10475 [Vicinamibacterales bacterium]